MRAVQHALKDLVEVEALVETKADVAQARQAVAQRRYLAGRDHPAASICPPRCTGAGGTSNQPGLLTTLGTAKN